MKCLIVFAFVLLAGCAELSPIDRIIRDERDCLTTAFKIAEYRHSQGQRTKIVVAFKPATAHSGWGWHALWCGEDNELMPTTQVGWNTSVVCNPKFWFWWQPGMCVQDKLDSPYWTVPGFLRVRLGFCEWETITGGGLIHEWKDGGKE
jgi:hypothetical protein